MFTPLTFDSVQEQLHHLQFVLNAGKTCKMYVLYHFKNYLLLTSQYQIFSYSELQNELQLQALVTLNEFKVLVKSLQPTLSVCKHL